MTNHRHRPPRPPQPQTEVLFARLPAELVEWIRQQAGRSGLSMAQAAGAMLAYCRASGMTLEPAAPAPRLDLTGGASSPLARPPLS